MLFCKKCKIKFSAENFNLNSLEISDIIKKLAGKSKEEIEELLTTINFKKRIQIAESKFLSQELQLALADDLNEEVSRTLAKNPHISEKTIIHLYTVKRVAAIIYNPVTLKSTKIKNLIVKRGIMYDLRHLIWALIGEQEKPIKPTHITPEIAKYLNTVSFEGDSRTNADMLVSKDFLDYNLLPEYKSRGVVFTRILHKKDLEKFYHNTLQATKMFETPQGILTLNKIQKGQPLRTTPEINRTIFDFFTRFSKDLDEMYDSLYEAVKEKEPLETSNHGENSKESKTLKQALNLSAPYKGHIQVNFKSPDDFIESHPVTRTVSLITPEARKLIQDKIKGIHILLNAAHTNGTVVGHPEHLPVYDESGMLSNSKVTEYLHYLSNIGHVPSEYKGKSTSDNYIKWQYYMDTYKKDINKDIQMLKELEEGFLNKLASNLVLYHGTSKEGAENLLKAQTFSWDHLQQRDHGYFGKGFYTATTPEHARLYGKSLLKIIIKPSARILEVLEEGSLIPTKPPSWHKSFANFLYKSVMDYRNKEDMAEMFVKDNTPGDPEFDRLSWYKNVTNWVIKTKYADVVKFLSEVVIVNPDAIDKIEKYSVKKGQ